MKPIITRRVAAERVLRRELSKSIPGDCIIVDEFADVGGDGGWFTMRVRIPEYRIIDEQKATPK